MENRTDFAPLREKIAELFAIDVDEDDMKSSPLFTNILTDMCNFFKNNDANRLDALQAKMKYLEAKSSFFEHLIFVSALRRVTNSSPNCGTNKVLCKCNNEATISVPTYLNMGLRNNDLSLKESQNSSELSKDFFPQHFSPLDKQFTARILLQASEVIKQLCQSILEFQEQEFSEDCLFQKLHQVLNAVMKENEEMIIKESNLHNYRLLNNNLMNNYMESCLRGVQLLRQKMEFRKTEIQICCSSANYIYTKNEALLLKARLLELQILNDTYSKEIVNALKIIRNQQQQKVLKLEAQISEKSMLLQRYEGIGKEFESLVKEYTELSVRLKEQKWTLQQLKKHQAT